jgi:hypothetical protein
MKTTIKTDYTGRLVVQPLKLQKMVMVTSTDAFGETVTIEMTPDQAGAMLFGMEQALRAIGCDA